MRRAVDRYFFGAGVKLSEIKDKKKGEK